MGQGKASWLMLVLAALLVFLQFFGVMTPAASKHITHRPAPESPAWSTSKVVDQRTDEFATCSDDEHAAELPSWLRARDRHRTVGFTPQWPERALPPKDRTDAEQRLGHAAFGLLRPSTAHSPAVLQVFRC